MSWHGTDPRVRRAEDGGVTAGGALPAGAGLRQPRAEERPGPPRQRDAAQGRAGEQAPPEGIYTYIQTHIHGDAEGELEKEHRQIVSTLS